jgi:hypothetical protein
MAGRLIGKRPLTATERQRRWRDVSGQVEERPLLAILIAAGIGYLLGRFLSP